MTDQPTTETIALPARWECGHGVADDEPFCAEAEDDGHVCPTIRVHPDDAEAFAALVDEANRPRAREVLRKVADMADPEVPEVSFFGGMIGPAVAAWLRMIGDDPESVARLTVSAAGGAGE